MSASASAKQVFDAIRKVIRIDVPYVTGFRLEAELGKPPTLTLISYVDLMGDGWDEVERTFDIVERKDEAVSD